MRSFSASVPGKIILFGEHAVVYGQPAIAVPVTQVRAKASVRPDIRGESGGLHILAPDIGLDASLGDLPPGNPIGEALNGVAAHLGVDQIPACTLEIHSTIPVAAGLGSGAAVSVAIIRALSAFLGHPLPDKQVSSLAYEIEKIHHGTPSGIDNTVVTYAKPVYFTRRLPSTPKRGAIARVQGCGKERKRPVIQTFAILKPFTIIIGDTGTPSLTKESVGDVRQAWQADRERYERLFGAIGSIAKTARQSIENGYPERLGPLMDENHDLLREMGVSAPELDRLVSAARKAGALGAKLSGGGRGGNMIALAQRENAPRVSLAMRSAGAVNTITTEVGR